MVRACGEYRFRREDENEGTVHWSAVLRGFFIFLSVARRSASLLLKTSLMIFGGRMSNIPCLVPNNWPAFTCNEADVGPCRRRRSRHVVSVVSRFAHSRNSFCRCTEVSMESLGWGSSHSILNHACDTSLTVVVDFGQFRLRPIFFFRVRPVRLRPISTSANFDFGQFRLRPISTSANFVWHL